jgi:DNA-binding NarL/FixJ family response regulator
MAKTQLVLIVDDNKNFVERMICLLNETEDISQIRIASDYDEACSLFSEKTPDIVLLDINLPGKSGIEFLKEIKKSGNECKIIMISNHADDYYREKCKELGADYFLDKSNDFAMVTGLLGELNQS